MSNTSTETIIKAMSSKGVNTEEGISNFRIQAKAAPLQTTRKALMLHRIGALNGNNCNLFEMDGYFLLMLKRAKTKENKRIGKAQFLESLEDTLKHFGFELIHAIDNKDDGFITMGDKIQICFRLNSLPQ